MDHQRITYPNKEAYTFGDVVELVQLLRRPDGCPWDRVQTHESIRRNLIEETYEACEAIDTQDTELLKEELGDVLLQVAFHAVLEQEAGRFNADDVCDGVCRKLLRRHPHVFGDVEAGDSETALKRWEEIKKKEHERKTLKEILQGVSKTLPSLLRAEKVRSKAAKNGFRVPQVTGEAESIRETAARLAAAEGEDAKQLMGELLMHACALAYLKDVDPEEALERETDRFVAESREA